MVESIRNANTDLGTPLMIKSRRGAYGSQGNAVLRADDNALVDTALRELFGKNRRHWSRSILTCSTQRSGSPKIMRLL